MRFRDIFGNVINFNNGEYDLESLLNTFFGGASTLFFAILLPIVFIGIALIVYSIVISIKAYKKMGRSGWEAIIPYYNKWVLVEVAGLNWWWILLYAASLAFDETWVLIVTFVAGYVVNYNISKKFDRGVSFALLLTIFPIIGYSVIVFNKQLIFDPNKEVSKNGPFNE